MPKVICAVCKDLHDVDEAPPALTSFVCESCEAFRKKAPREHKKHIPRKKHGTRVMLPITCARCGKDDTLDYVPKGADFDDVLCSECADAAFGDRTDWQKVQQEKEKEAKKEYPFTCDECGRKDYLPFKPKEDRVYSCNMCRFEHDTPSKDRLEGRQKAGGAGVFIRRKNKASDTSDAPPED